MLKTKQNRKNIFHFVKLILFIGVLFLVYWQVSTLDDNAWMEFELSRSLSLFTAVALVFTNIWLAYLKWKITLNVLVPKSSTYVTRQSFFAGLITGMLTPNMVGNFIGRFYYFERKHRVPITLFTLLANYAQFLASITFGWISVLIVGGVYFYNEKSLIIWLGIAMIVAYLLYFFIDNFLSRIRQKGYFKTFKETLEKHRFYRIKILALSLGRFVIFTVQFSLVLDAFGEPISLVSILAIWQVYLVTMLVPSLFLGKIGVRESVSLFVLTGIGMNTYAVLFASLIIWFVNSLAPAIIGLIICKRPENDSI